MSFKTCFILKQDPISESYYNLDFPVSFQSPLIQFFYVMFFSVSFSDISSQLDLAYEYLSGVYYINLVYSFQGFTFKCT
jgi:hypothetical protein